MSCDCPYSVIHKELVEVIDHRIGTIWNIKFNDDDCNMKLLYGSKTVEWLKLRPKSFIDKISDVTMMGILKILKEKKPCECISNLKSNDHYQFYTGCSNCNTNAFVEIEIVNRRKNIVKVRSRYIAIDCLDEQTQRQVDAFAKSHETSESQSSCHHSDSSC
jgi:hypothetical protein